MRAERIELSTPCLKGRCSTTELRPQRTTNLNRPHFSRKTAGTLHFSYSKRLYFPYPKKERVTQPTDYTLRNLETKTFSLNTRIHLHMINLPFVTAVRTVTDSNLFYIVIINVVTINPCRGTFFKYTATMV